MESPHKGPAIWHIIGKKHPIIKKSLTEYMVTKSTTLFNLDPVSKYTVLKYLATLKIALQDGMK